MIEERGAGQTSADGIRRAAVSGFPKGERAAARRASGSRAHGALESRIHELRLELVAVPRQRDGQGRARTA
jgi:hypothetical protein